jgi:hypothetical protein
MSCITQIGATAGMIWQVLSTIGDVRVGLLVKYIVGRRVVVIHGLGLLASEDMVNMEEEARSRVVSLKE